MSTSIKEMIKNYISGCVNYNFFDVNCWWDYTDYKTFHAIEKFSQLENELQSHYIKKAVITSFESLKHDPIKGNENLAELIKEKNNLYGCMILVPELIFFDRMISEYIDRKIEQGFVCARMFPKTLRHSMQEWAVGNILKYLEEKRLPLIIWHNEVSWELIESLCKAYKKLPIIVEGNDTKLLYHNRNYIPLLKKYDNLYLETHNIVLFSELDFLANHINSKKLIFGTYFPYNTPNATIMAITEGNFPEESKYDIAGNNLEELINRIK